MLIFRARTWLLLSVILFGLSAIAVAGQFMPWSGLRRLCESFASPGELLWWVTLGGVFSGYPHGASGYVVWVLGTTTFWLLAIAFVVTMVKGIRSLILHLRR
jgi:hypothetical protein